jgi:hypothetical protein
MEAAAFMFAMRFEHVVASHQRAYRSDAVALQPLDCSAGPRLSARGSLVPGHEGSERRRWQGKLVFFWGL